ncbi:stress-related protein [Tanacetum coccineum]
MLDVPFAVLMFVDVKVGDVLVELDRHVPSLMKQVPDKAMYVAHNLPEVAKDLASEGLKTTSKVAHT